MQREKKPKSFRFGNKRKYRRGTSQIAIACIWLRGLPGKSLFLPSVFLILLFGSVNAVQGEDTGEISQTLAVSDFLQQLVKTTSTITSLQTDFVQEKELAAFKNKLIIKGRIYLVKPNKIAWHIDEPVKYSVIITDKFMEQWDEDTDQVQKIPFSKIPMLQVLLNNVKGWFSGDYVSFLKDYDARILKRKPPVITFVPKAKSAAKAVVKNIEICIKKGERYLEWLKIEDVSGDSTIIHFKNTIINSPIDTVFFEVKRGA